MIHASASEVAGLDERGSHDDGNSAVEVRPGAGDDAGHHHDNFASNLNSYIFHMQTLFRNMPLQKTRPWMLFLLTLSVIPRL